MNILELERKQCSGCKACADICPTCAISFEVNNEGFWYPKVDSAKCVDCGKCRGVCPCIDDSSAKTIGRVYAAWSKDDDIRRESTSGGVFYEIARYVLNRGGYIVGSVYTEDFRSAYFDVGKSEDDLNRIMGSKYFQSDAEGIYKKVKELLGNDILVLFTGTPCQIKALKLFLKDDYKNLITLDFICRGVPSPKLQGMKIDLYEKKEHSKVVSYRDKSKYVGWNNFGELIKFENGKERFISRWNDKINDCFIHKNLNIRESCYSCLFKDGNNYSDITLGDFWGITGVTEKDYRYGVSAVIINSDLGMQILEELYEHIYFWRRRISDIKTENEAYEKAVSRPDARENFYNMVNTDGLEKTVDYYMKEGLKPWLTRKYMVLKSKLVPYKFLITKYSRVRLIQFIYYNYFSPCVKRKKHCFFIPYNGTVLQIDKTARIELNASIRLNYYPWYKKTSDSTLFRMSKNSTLVVNNTVELCYKNTFAVGENATVEVGHFFTGVGANVICNNSISIGNNVMLGRDTCIFDSDYHEIFDDNMMVINSDQEVVIEDNVWIASRAMVLKGTHIHHGSIVGAGTIVSGDVEPDKIFVNKKTDYTSKKTIAWSRFK